MKKYIVCIICILIVMPVNKGFTAIANYLYMGSNLAIDLNDNKLPSGLGMDLSVGIETYYKYKLSVTHQLNLGYNFKNNRTSTPIHSINYFYTLGVRYYPIKDFFIGLPLRLGMYSNAQGDYISKLGKRYKNVFSIALGFSMGYTFMIKNKDHMTIKADVFYDFIAIKKRTPLVPLFLGLTYELYCFY